MRYKTVQNVSMPWPRQPEMAYIFQSVTMRRYNLPHPINGIDRRPFGSSFVLRLYIDYRIPSILQLERVNIRYTSPMPICTQQPYTLTMNNLAPNNGLSPTATVIYHITYFRITEPL